MALRSLQFGAFTRDRENKNGGVVIVIALVISAVCYLIAILLRFGISRSREYMADAGAAEITRKPYALANALRKISQDPLIEAVQRRDIAQLFIENPQPEEKKFSLSNFFSTHPPIERKGLRCLISLHNGLLLRAGGYVLLCVVFYSSIRFSMSIFWCKTLIISTIFFFWIYFL